jgi:hypothetical protein
MPMTFEEAETRFRQLQARVQRGESISRAEYEEEVGKLAVQDRNGTLWEINPRTGKWMYFDGAEWVSGAPPGHDTSTVMPVLKEILASERETQPAPPAASAPPPVPPSTRPAAPSALSPARPAAPARAPAAPSEPPPFIRTEQKQKPPARQKPPAAPPSAPTSERPARKGPLGGRNREWVPLAIGAVVLLFCAVLLFVTAQFVLPLLSPRPTPTRTLSAAQATGTKVPTPMLLPSPTPIPPTPAPVTAKVTATTLNVRTEPSSKSKSVGTLKKDNQVTFLTQAKGEKIEGEDTWYLINLPNSSQQGWVFFGKNFQILSGDPKTLPVGGAATPTPTKGAVVPAGPTATLTPIGVIPPTPKAYP